MAQIDIGKLSIGPHKGDYNNSTAYVANDIVAALLDEFVPVPVLLALNTIHENPELELVPVIAALPKVNSVHTHCL